MIDELLKKYGLKYEELTPDERTTFHTMLDAIEQKQLTIEKIKDFIVNMKYSVEQELVKTETNTKQDFFLKARLKNYMLFEAFLLSPEKAKKALEQSLSNVKK
ncbi:MAG: hypothetical protein UT62_C0008G0007 [Parcubacteria group bacterium GW2011_GWC1_39_8]|nr:MAG: hypothetical protein UT62_C0008G0007 [Parcubacteria group bacterium GW2011_GWC1_39_8]